jgi:ubiquitin C-terminal hydrolase
MSFGLRNIGGTCYLNSVLQVLRHVSSFKEAVENSIPEDAIVISLKDIFTSLKSQTYSAAPIVSTMKIKLGADSSGFALAMILDNIPKEFSKMFELRYTGCDSASTLIITDRIGKTFSETINNYCLKTFPQTLLVDFTGNPNFSFKFPIAFDCANDTYDLIAAIIFIPGHYYAVCRSDNLWRVFNDSNVSTIPQNNIQVYMNSHKPLVVAYERNHNGETSLN